MVVKLIKKGIILSKICTFLQQKSALGKIACSLN